MHLAGPVFIRPFADKPEEGALGLSNPLAWIDLLSLCFAWAPGVEDVSFQATHFEALGRGYSALHAIPVLIDA